MNWTDEEVEATCEVMHDAYEDAAVRNGWTTQERSRKPWADVPEANKATMRVAVRIAMTRAVELAAARGGTMTAERLAYVAEVLTAADGKGGARLAREIADAFSALGARNAVLEAEKTEFGRALTAANDRRLSAEDTVVSLRERISAAEEGNRELVRRAQQAEAMADSLQRTCRERHDTIRRLSDDVLVWRKRIEAASEELADIGAGEVGRLDIVSRVRMLKEQSERRRQDRADALSVKTTEGLSASEWMLRAGKAEREVAELKAQLSEARIARDTQEMVDLGIIERLEARCATLSAAGQVLSAHVDKHGCEHDQGGPCDNCAGVQPETCMTHHRHPCSTTCTHDDAATPGHSRPPRAGERAERGVQQRRHSGQPPGVVSGPRGRRRHCGRVRRLRPGRRGHARGVLGGGAGGTSEDGRLRRWHLGQPQGRHRRGCAVIVKVSVGNATTPIIGFTTVCQSADVTWAVEHLRDTVNPPPRSGVAIIIRRGA